ncbi:hypothetical protein KUH32_00855 [Thalassococcus sp. CAU 1522]|uniref:DUF3299 domain-containing protein n=1 Tax=Thalassococcus arenae TaxID=2851652 RepID=A0ABS6N2S3_9RHOB|nr:hypothetical protein [Thalassococcus arenae]MBV2358311.1 hypothetical protein [Thalassococcus arenae]
MTLRSSSLALAAAFGSTATASHANPSDVWALLKQIEIDEIVTDTNYEVRKTYPTGIAEEQMVEITGYAAPMMPGTTFRELVLVSDMGLCPFCGSVDHGAALQVTLADPIDTVDETRRITLRGTLKRVNDPETWQAVILENAQIVTQ